MEFEDKTLMFDIRELQNITEPKKRTASFIALAGSQAGRMHKLSHAEMIIGRVSDADIRFEGYGVSRHHAKVDIQPDGSIVLTDLDSTNGTGCNRPLSWIRWNPGSARGVTPVLDSGSTAS